MISDSEFVWFIWKLRNFIYEYISLTIDVCQIMKYFNIEFCDNIGDMMGKKKHILLYLSSYNTLIFLGSFCYKNLKLFI